jgi:hypothetical protein
LVIVSDGYPSFVGGKAVVELSASGTPNSKNILSNPAGPTELSIRAVLPLSFLNECGVPTLFPSSPRWCDGLLVVLSLVFLLAVIVGFLQPTCEVGVQVFLFVDPQEVNDAGVFFLYFFDAAMLQASAQDEHNIEPVLADGHSRKDCSHLEENSCLRRCNQNIATTSDQAIKLLVQLDNLL